MLQGNKCGGSRESTGEGPSGVDLSLAQFFDHQLFVAIFFKTWRRTKEFRNMLGSFSLYFV
jgi:hypothetical protein